MIGQPITPCQTTFNKSLCAELLVKDVSTIVWKLLLNQVRT